MKSMTGYGKATVLRDDRELTVELKSVNHRFLDISIKIPRAFVQYEDAIRSVLTKQLARGHVDVFVNYSLVGESDKTVELDEALAAQYVGIARRLAALFPEMSGGYDINALMRTGDVVTVRQRDEDEAVVRDMLLEALQQAALNLNAMREREGNALKSDILGKIDNLESQLSKAEQFAPLVAEQYRGKLRDRIAEALCGVELDESRLANEVCFFADKCCIDEEITRLHTHIEHARQIFATDGAVGRKLDFLVQEFNRETNTICSKSCNTDLTNVALDMKNEIEKIREQIQNLE